ncbi:hypothetical protein [Nocardia sp. NPDC051570]|uniref:hypothetical protein n=1 Tax=Nocardia sp. NPDC051570 TaxID=3364324 RepID=UPI003799A349
MIYTLMAGSGDVSDSLQRILSELFQVAESEVDIAPRDTDWDVRNSHASVTCDIDKLEGDLRWEFWIYASGSVPVQPTEGAVAIFLARSINVPVFFPGDSVIPSLYGVATPQGRLSRAILEEPEESDDIVVAELEVPMMEFPGAVIHELSSAAGNWSPEG